MVGRWMEKRKRGLRRNEWLGGGGRERGSGRKGEVDGEEEKEE
jgi:hypothetical protein